MATMAQPGYSGPIIDGRTILGGALDAAKVGLYARVPLIIGANSADGFPIGTDKDNIFSTFGKHESMARELYDPDGDAGGLEVATKVSADMIFIEPARAITRTLAAKDYNVWLYRFAHVGVQSGIAMGGAPHASEIPYVFDLPERRLQKLESEQDRAVASLMHQYWVNFAKTGNPNGDGLPDWPRGSANTTTVQLIDTDETKHVEDPRTATLDFRESLFNH